MGKGLSVVTDTNKNRKGETREPTEKQQEYPECERLKMGAKGEGESREEEGR